MVLHACEHKSVHLYTCPKIKSPPPHLTKPPPWVGHIRRKLFFLWKAWSENPKFYLNIHPTQLTSPDVTDVLAKVPTWTLLNQQGMQGTKPVPPQPKTMPFWYIRHLGSDLKGRDPRQLSNLPLLGDEGQQALTDPWESRKIFSNDELFGCPKMHRNETHSIYIGSCLPPFSEGP